MYFQSPGVASIRGRLIDSLAGISCLHKKYLRTVFVRTSLSYVHTLVSSVVVIYSRPKFSNHIRVQWYNLTTVAKQEQNLRTHSR